MTIERRDKMSRLRALNLICLQCSRRLAIHDSSVTRKIYEEKKAERDALRKELYNV